LSQPQYRLPVGDIRVFYDVTKTQVQILAIVTKAEAQAWLDEQRTPAQNVTLSFTILTIGKYVHAAILRWSRRMVAASFQERCS